MDFIFYSPHWELLSQGKGSMAGSDHHPVFAARSHGAPKERRGRRFSLTPNRFFFPEEARFFEPVFFGRNQKVNGGDPAFPTTWGQKTGWRSRWRGASSTLQPAFHLHCTSWSTNEVGDQQTGAPFPDTKSLNAHDNLHGGHRLRTNSRSIRCQNLLARTQRSTQPIHGFRALQIEPWQGFRPERDSYWRDPKTSHIGTVKLHESARDPIRLEETIPESSC